jgi:hypothetical protein
MSVRRRVLIGIAIALVTGLLLAAVGWIFYASVGQD